MSDTTPTTESRRKGAGKVLSFEQKGEFFYKRALDRLDQNKLADALGNYRKALELEPDNDEIRLAMAEVLCEMERFDESNRILLPMSAKPECDPECYFGLGCNFMGLNELPHAKDALERYAELAPDGEFIFDAFDMLDAIDDEEYGESEGAEGVLVAISKKDEALDAAEEGRKLLEAERYDKAEEKLLLALRLDPALHWARNNLTLAFFCRREYRRAANEAEAVLAQEPKNLQALCNLAMIKHSMRDKAGANSTASAMLKCETDDPEDLNRMSLVLMDLSRYQEALPLMRKLRARFPYDEGTLHRLAICAFHADRFNEAGECYETLLRLNPRDSIARYYRGLCRAAQASGTASPVTKRKFMLNYQVPFDETIARVNRLNELVCMPRAELVKLWNSGGELSGLIEWGFTLPDGGIKHALLTLVSSFSDKKSEAMLRELLLYREQSDEVKREALALLSAQGAQEPYMVYLGGRLVESRVTRAAGQGVSKPYRDALVICLNSMQARHNDQALGCAVMLWEKYLRGQSVPLPRLTRAQTNAFAAALEYLACRECGEKPSKSDICANYGVSALRFKNALAKLEKA